MTAKASKADFYAKELDLARLKGAWSSATPCNDAGGKPIAWPELLRKYMKHNPEETVLPSVASQEQQIRACLEAFWKESGYSDLSHAKDEAQPGSGHTTFPPTLPRDQFGAGWSGKTLSDGVRQLDELKGATREGSAKLSIVAMQALALSSTGDDEKAIELIHSSDFMTAHDEDSLSRGPDYNVALALMGYTLYGMANEKLHGAKPDAGYLPFAHAGYAKAIDLHEALRGGKRANALRGLGDDEVERWAETALYRNALLSVREGDLTEGLNALRAYQAHVGRWPSNFRTPQRNVIYRTYLRELGAAVEKGGYLSPPPASSAARSQADYRSSAYQRAVVDLVASRLQMRDFESERLPRHGQARRMLGVDAKGITSRTTSKRRPAPHRSLRPASAAWSNELLTVQNAAATCLQNNTELPKAGNANVQALQLSDDLMRGWRLNGELGGENADDVVEILYSLSRVTFQSQRISRYLFTVLVAAEAYEEARRAAELYISIYEKAREAELASAKNMAGDSRKAANGASHSNGVGSKGASDAGLDHDDEETFVRTLAHAAHVLVRYLHDAEAADKLASRALETTQAGPLKSDQALLALVMRVAGGSRAALSYQVPDPLRRQDLHDEALTLLKQSAALDPQSSETLYQLAHLQAEMRDVGSAVRNARKALELEPADVETWHLLTLLISAQKDHKSALRIAEEALAEAEEDDEADLQAIQQAGGAVANGAGANGGAKAAVTSVSRTTLLSVDYPPSAAERAQSILRLMVTHNALTEAVEGSVAAIEGQKELFEFYHLRVSTTPTDAPRLKSSFVPGQTSGGLPQARGTHSTLLSSSTQAPHRLGTLSGLGQSGTGLGKHHLSLHRKRATSAAQGQASADAVPPGAVATAEADQVGASAVSPTALRNALHRDEEQSLLCSLWLMAAASFRRAGKHDESRVAIQECERIDAGNADLWLQLALWFESDDVALAISTLYKSLACAVDHVGAAVHLARLFIDHPQLSPSSAPADANGASAAAAAPKPRTSDTDELLPSALARLVNASANERVTGSDGARPDDHSPGGRLSRYASTSEAQASAEKQRLSALSLAEGLLTTVTSGRGWDCAEAWLYLGRVAQRTARPQKARDCLGYALKLEETKPIRPLSLAVRRC